mgnify:CR=1 FL=1
MGQPVIYEVLTLEAAPGLAERRGIVIVPAATTEAHGSHLQHGTDTFAAEWIARELSARTGVPALVPTPFHAGDAAQRIPTPPRERRSAGGLGTVEAIRSAAADKGPKVPERATERSFAFIRNIDTHNAPHEGPAIDVRERPRQPQCTVAY